MAMARATLLDTTCQVESLTTSGSTKGDAKRNVAPSLHSCLLGKSDRGEQKSKQQIQWSQNANHARQQQVGLHCAPLAPPPPQTPTLHHFNHITWTTLKANSLRHRTMVRKE